MSDSIRKRLTEKLGKPIDRNKINLADRIICQYRYNLDLEQQEFLETRKNCKKSHILELAQETYKNKTLIEQSEEFKNVRKFLDKVIRESYCSNYNDEQLDYIFNNGNKKSAYEIAGDLFPDEEQVLSIKNISHLIAAAGLKLQEGNPETENALGFKYNPPKTDLQIVNLINKYDFSAKYDYNDLDSKQKESVARVKRFLSAPRYVELMSTMTNQRHREVFESEFVKAVYDKIDLNSDQVNLYIALALEHVTLLEIRQQISILNTRLAESVSDDEDSRKFTMSLSEALKDKTAAYNQCLQRTLNMTKSLSGDRIKQLEKQAAVNQSLTQFIELVKEEKERRRLMLIARADEFKVKENIKELSSFPELFVEVFGLGKDEVFQL